MRLPRGVYGARLAAHLRKNWGYRYIHQTGSHIILDTATPGSHRISVPAHRPLKTGTFRGIIGAVADHKKVTVDEILHDL